MAGESTASRVRRVLLFADTEGLVSDWLPVLAAQGEVRVVRTATEAQAALQQEHFDVAVTPGSELLPILSSVGRDQARLILDAIAQGVCSVGADGQAIWVNAALRAYPPEVREAVRVACGEMYAAFAMTPAQRTGQRELSVGEKLKFELTATAILNASGGVERVVAVIWDMTSIARMREKLDAVDAAGRELVALESDDAARLDVPERLRLLEDKLIHYCRELLDFTHFMVRVVDPQTGRLDTVLSGGFSEQANTTVVYARPEGNGISGYVASTGKSYVCPDVTRDPRYMQGLEHACSSLTVPLRLNERIVGVLNVESDQPAKFNDEDRQFAEILGRYVAVALHMLKLLVVERSETTGQLAADVRAEAASPLDDIVAEATHVLHGGVATEDARRRLQNIIVKVERVKAALQAVTESPAIAGLVPEEHSVDPLLARRRVLVADDEDIIRETIADVLSKVGAWPVMARDGEEACALFATQPFDLVLSDIKMPHKSGYEVFAAAKQANPHCPVILITGFGYDPEHSIVRASQEGLAGVLFKPFKVEQLMELIHQALAPAPAHG